MINETPPLTSLPPGPASYNKVTRVAVPLGEKVVTPERAHIQLVAVLDDSRCPKGVDCSWPGEAKIEAYIIPPYKDGRRIRAARSFLTIPGATRFAEASAANTVSSDQWSIVFYGLEPYPEANQITDVTPAIQALFAVVPISD